MLKIISILKNETNEKKEQLLLPYITMGYKINSIVEKKEKKIIVLPMGYNQEVEEEYEVYYLINN